MHKAIVVQWLEWWTGNPKVVGLKTLNPARCYWWGRHWL